MWNSRFSSSYEYVKFGISNDGFGLSNQVENVVEDVIYDARDYALFVGVTNYALNLHYVPHNK